MVKRYKHLKSCLFSPSSWRLCCHLTFPLQTRVNPKFANLAGAKGFLCSQLHLSVNGSASPVRCWPVRLTSTMFFHLRHWVQNKHGTVTLVPNMVHPLRPEISRWLCLRCNGWLTQHTVTHIAAGAERPCSCSVTQLRKRHCLSWIQFTPTVRDY